MLNPANCLYSLKENKTLHSFNWVILIYVLLGASVSSEASVLSEKSSNYFLIILLELTEIFRKTSNSSPRFKVQEYFGKVEWDLCYWWLGPGCSSRCHNRYCWYSLEQQSRHQALYGTRGKQHHLFSRCSLQYKLFLVALASFFQWENKYGKHFSITNKYKNFSCK